MWRTDGRQETAYNSARFLLKGFASRIGDKEAFVWIHGKGTPAREDKITNVSVERYFYGRPGDLNVDDQITDLETNCYSSVVQGLRDQPADSSAHGDAAALVAHCCVRTRQLRESFAHGLDFLIGETYMTDEERRNILCSAMSASGLGPEGQKRLMPLMDVIMPGLLQSVHGELHAMRSATCCRS